MIISDSKSFVFIHNPKAAGTSIRKALDPYRNPGIDYWGFAQYPILGNRVVDIAHIPLDLLIQLHPEIFVKVQSFYSFGFVREPFQRFFSAVYQHLTFGTPYNKAALTKNREIFEHYVSEFACANLDAAKIDADYTLAHFIPQKRFFYVYGTKCAEYFKVENLATIPEKLVELGLVSVGKENTSQSDLKVNGAFNIASLTAEAHDRIVDFYREDFEAFGYSPNIA